MDIRATFVGVLLLWISLPTYGLDLESALFETVATNPDIAQKRHELSMAYQELEISRSGYLPKINLRSSIARERANTQMTGFENRDFNTLNTNITLTQNLFSGFATSAETSAKQHMIQMNMYALEEKINDLSLRLIKGYLEVLKSHELLLIEKENVYAHEKMYQKITLKAQSGSARSSDQKEVLAKLALSYVNTLTQDNNYNDAAAALNRIMGRYVDIKTLIKPTVDFGTLPHSLESASEEALLKHPSVLVGKSEVESARESIDLERSSYYPKVDAELNGRTYDNANGTENVDKTASAMVTLSYNLYNGGSDEARLKRSLAQASTATDRLKSIERGVLEEMALAYNSYQILQRQKPYLELYRDANGEKSRLYHDEFDLGRRSLIDLLDSESEYSTSKRKAIENEYEMIYAYFRVLAAKNELIERFSVSSRSPSSAKGVLLGENLKQAPVIGKYPMIETHNPLQIIEEVPKEASETVRETETKVFSAYNPQKGYGYYLKAARLGDKESQMKVAALYEEGLGTTQDTAKALYWKNRATQREKAPNLKKAHYFKELGEQFFNPKAAVKPHIAPYVPPIPATMDEKAKSLGERLKELGII